MPPGEAPLNHHQPLRKVFEYLKAFTELRFPPVKDIEQQKKVLRLDKLPLHPSVELFSNGLNAPDESEASGIVLRVTRPSMSVCPPPPASIANWIKPGWNDVDKDAECYSSMNVAERDGYVHLDQFDDVQERVATLTQWRKLRREWQRNERPARDAAVLFQAIYEWFGIRERESEEIEILVGEGLLNCSNDSGDFNHQVLLQRVDLEFYPEKSNPQFVFRKRDQPPELYLELLRAVPGANLRQLSVCIDELKKAEISPLGRQDTEGFLKRLVQGVFAPTGQWITTTAANQSSNSQPDNLAPEPAPLLQPKSVTIRLHDGQYELSDDTAFEVTGPITADNLGTCMEQLRQRGWEPRLSTIGGTAMRRAPVIFMRKRQSGMSNVFDLILEDIANRLSFPEALIQIIGGNSPIPSDNGNGVSQQSLGNEAEDILLSKPANKEQLEIARQLSRRNCVLVQGPPGTGKTHTIANLLGHLLANGKSVLVTAHTPKALRVLREQVVESLQPLCISVLQNDKQSQEELRQSVRLLHTGLSQDETQLAREAEQLQRSRTRIIRQLATDRSTLLDAVHDETRSIVFGGREVRPIDAAKEVRAGIGTSNWIPSPVELGASFPLDHAEIAALYHSNALITPDDERELNTSRPDLAGLPPPHQFSDVLDEMVLLKSQDLRRGAEFWPSAQLSPTSPQFEPMLALAQSTIEFLRDRTSWQLDAIQAGRDGDEAKRVWLSLVEQIEMTWTEVQDERLLLMVHGPRLQTEAVPAESLTVVEEIIRHLETGASLGLRTRITRPGWHRLINAAYIGSNKLNPGELVQFRAIRALLKTELARENLVGWWKRQVSAQGGPSAEQLGERPEQVCREYVPQIQACLNWHDSKWTALQTEFERVGFDWSAYLQSVSPQNGANGALQRLRMAVLGDLESILKARAGWLRLEELQMTWSAWTSKVANTDSSGEATAARKLREALVTHSAAKYKESYDELARLKSMEAMLETRRELLRRLGRSAPAWASAIENRHPRHCRPDLPGDPEVAWAWVQMHGELERRANTSVQSLQQRIEGLSRELLHVTSLLVEKMTWVHLIRKTLPEQKRALGLYSAMREKLTKTGQGVQDAEMRAGARREMAAAKGAVPVWIMPLNEVAETFDPRQTRFDVVIIDEASQCDPTSMFALYLGDQTVIVGDDEQVTPVAVGVDMEQVQKLREVHLQGIPGKELYDGVTSIYEFAQSAFGGVIRLVEHFRCAPDIIAFSNSLSYNGEIKPLREASSVRFSSHVLPYRVQEARGRTEGINDSEAEVIASLVCAAIEQPEYAVNKNDKPVSFGVVSLVGESQAMRVDALLRAHLEPAEYKNRRVLCGHAAQFQGDERDVTFLSMVDCPPAQPPLPMRQEGPKKIFKKRFNVAASRARDQMWVVYSLNHETDLKPGDFRRRLIEHALDPSAWERELERTLAQVDPRSKEFEGRVVRRLLAANFRVLPQYRVGGYRIDIVITGSGKRLAVECDGERFHGPEKLQEDMERQAILERLGWQFIRIRGSVFFRDEDRAMLPVFQRLEELGIAPELDQTNGSKTAEDDAVTQRIIRRAEELRRQWSTQASESSETPEEILIQHSHRRRFRSARSVDA